MCGIFGFFGNDKSTFNINKFNLLGIYNDSRGGDSCGIYIDSIEKKGVFQEKLYTSFLVRNIDFMKEFNTHTKIALGHCRKASVGRATLEQAQPVIITNEDGEDILIMIHNGTLLNYKELAKKYEIEFEQDWSDSQIFALIVSIVGYEVLSEYNGAGAFVFYEPKTNNTYLFKGESQEYENSKTLKEERPFFLLRNDGGIYFSSINDTLHLISDNNIEIDKITTLKANHLYCVKEGEIISSKEYDRSKRYQLEHKYWNRYDEYDYTSNKDNKNKSINQNINTSPNNFKTHVKKLVETRGTYLSSDTIKLSNEGLYENQYGVINGEKVLNKDGESKNDSIVLLNNPIYKTFYFSDGIIMNSYLAYRSLCYFKQIMSLINVPVETLDLVKFSYLPVYVKEVNMFLENDIYGKATFFTGSYKVLFSYYKIYEIIDGEIQNYSFNNIKEKSEFDTYIEDKTNDYFKKLEKEKPQKFKKEIKKFLFRNIEDFNTIDNSIINEVINNN